MMEMEPLEKELKEFKKELKKEFLRLKESIASELIIFLAEELPNLTVDMRLQQFKINRQLQEKFIQRLAKHGITATIK